ncbi:MFS transporter [Macrococcus carouselicus]|uniref:MFS transporter n=1 Tax=Macrococcus carouselicus TaxID=69969 RepID=A0A9Q8CIJ7_9STAP|nr:MFS transporter [Macrococcus carouselicus]TDM02481.1 MFS transporter [Macrococcus carouselicus]
MRIRDLPVNIHVRLWGSFISRIAASAVFPFMALYLTEEVSRTFAGLFLSLTVLFSFIINIIAGYICDRLPRKKLLVFLSYMDGLFLSLMAWTVYLNQIHLFLIFFMMSLTATTLKRPAFRALVQDSATPENRKLIYQLDYWLVNLSIALGAAIGGVLYHEHKVLLFFMLGVITLFIAVIYHLIIEETYVFIREKAHANVFRDLLHSYAEVSKNKPFVILVLGGVFIMCAELSTSSYVAVRLAETFRTEEIFGFKLTGVRMFSAINIINTLTVVSCTFLVSRVVAKLPLKRVMTIGFLMYGIGYTVLTSANVWWLIVIAILIATLGELIYAPIKNAEELDLIPPDKRGAYGAFSNLGFNGADLLSKSGIILGAYLNPLAMSGVMAVIVTLGAVCMLYSLFDRNNDLEKEGVV